MSAAERAGLSPARLANIDRHLRERYVDAGRFPGTLVQVWRSGALAYTSLVGLMDIARQKPMREEAIFRIRSMTKPITAVALMMLVEEGRITLSDDVALHIPSWANPGVYAGGESGSFRTVPAKRPMRIVDLVTHTAGLAYGSPVGSPVARAYSDLGIASGSTRGGLPTMIEQLAGLPLEFSPGEAWNYSVAIDVLGYIVEKIAREPFGAFLRRRLFAPLGMHDTAFFCPPEKRERLAALYESIDGGPLTLGDDPERSIHAAPPSLESGGGGLLSTSADYLRFCRMMLGGGTLDGIQILSPKTVALFGLNFLPDNREILDMSLGSDLFNEAGFAGVGFSLACGVTVDVARTGLPGTLGEYFWGGSSATAFWIDPKEELAVVFMSQVNNSPWRIQVRRDLRTLVYSAFTRSLT